MLKVKTTKKVKKQKDPLGVEYTGNAEIDSQAELTALQKSFQERAKQEDKRFIEATDSEFWVAVCFQNREQKEEFLKALNLLKLGDKYLDGMQVAKQLGVTLKTKVAPARRLKISQTWNEFI